MCVLVDGRSADAVTATMNGIVLPRRLLLWWALVLTQTPGKGGAPETTSQRLLPATTGFQQKEPSDRVRILQSRRLDTVSIYFSARTGTSSENLFELPHQDLRQHLGMKDLRILLHQVPETRLRSWTFGGPSSGGEMSSCQVGGRWVLFLHTMGQK